MKAFDISIPKAVWVDTDAEAEMWLEYFVESSKTNNIGLDSETTGVEIHKDTVVVWSLSDGKERICLLLQDTCRCTGIAFLRIRM